MNLNGKYDAGEPVLSNTKIIVYKLVPQKRRVRAAPAEKKEKLGEFTTKVDGTFIAVVTGTDFGDHIGLADTSRPNVILFRSRVGDDGYLLGRPEIVIVIKPSKTTVVAGPQTTDVPPKPSTTEVTTVTKTLPTNTETKTTETKTIKLTSTTTRTIPTYRITSDGTREKPLCSWGNECAINYGTQSLCAYHLCKSANFTYGVFVNASNDMCVDSATDAVVWMYLVDYREYAEDSFETEGHHTADCWNAELPEGSEVVVSTGFEGAPLCSWNSTCTWLVTAKGLLDLAEPTPLPVKFRDDATKAKCATALCTKAGFESGTFLSASNDMCTESATSDSVFSYIADTETHESGTRDKAAFITAACVPFPLI